MNLRLAALIPAVVLLLGCGSPQSSSQTETKIVSKNSLEAPKTIPTVEIKKENPSPKVKKAISSSGAALISGVIHYKGAVPKFKAISMNADPICLTHHTEPVYPEVLVLGEGQTLGNVFVHIRGGLPNKTYPVPTEPFVVNQKGCQYDPHVIGVRAGQPLRILNPDGTLHNVHAFPKKNPEFNLAMPKFRKETTKVFEIPEFMFPIKCDVHPWMGAWVSVMAHPYFTVTQADGKYVIDNLPPGTYELEAWHEKLGTKTAKVTVAAGESGEVDFVFSRPSKPE